MDTSSIKKMFFLWGFIVCCWYPGWAGEVCIQEKQSKPFFGTIVHIEVCYTEGSLDSVRYAMDRVWQTWEHIQKKTNRYDPTSDISLINASQGRAIWVDRDMARLLRRAIAFKDATKGVFDVTIPPLMDFWKIQTTHQSWPRKDEVAKVKGKVDANKVIISRADYVSLPDDWQLDLNGIVPGFAADEAFRILKDNGIRNFLIDAGGEIIISGHNSEGKPWRIGIKDPDNPHAFIGVVPLAEGAISTSGDYESFFEIQGKKYSKMINPITGYPSLGVVSATVVAPTAIEADVLSTALCILGPRDGFNLIKSFDDPRYAALILFRQQKGGRMVLHKTRNFSLIE